MVNKLGNDFLNNIMWNKEYPFIPEITNDVGFTIHELDIIEMYDEQFKEFYAGIVYKIYNKDFVWIRYYHKRIRKNVDYVCSANELLPHTRSCTPPKLQVDEFNNGCFNILEHFLGEMYTDLYYEELRAEDDWHFDEDKFDAKRQEEVNKIKSKY